MRLATTPPLRLHYATHACMTSNTPVASASHHARHKSLARSVAVHLLSFQPSRAAARNGLDRAVTPWHPQVVYKPYMAAFLDDIATAQSAAQLGNGDPRDGGASPALGDGSASEVAGSAAGAVVAAAGMPRWVEAILAALPDGKEDIQLGKQGRIPLLSCSAQTA